jgi:hypothetical protein
MCVRMMNPHESETVIDTAAGSAGFTVHSIFHVWKQIFADEGMPISNLFTMEAKPQRCHDYVRDKVFAIDFDEKSVRVARCLNLIAGDGQTNVLHLNTLDWPHWDERIKQDEDWQETYGPGWAKLKKLRQPKKQNRTFGFDVLMANPPFAGDIKQSDMLSPYELGHKTNGKLESKVGRDLLFIERNLDFLRPGGRMAVVLPQGRFNNSSDQRVREFIAERCRILAVVGLHPNTFKPHTGTKTSVLFVQKWNDDASDPRYHCPRTDDYPIFFATQQLPSKDNSGEKIISLVKAAPSPVRLDGRRQTDAGGSVGPGVATTLCGGGGRRPLSGDLSGWQGRGRNHACAGPAARKPGGDPQERGLSAAALARGRILSPTFARQPRALGDPTRPVQPRWADSGRHRRGLRRIRCEGETRFFLNRPFDAARYAGLLKGLEVSEILLSKLENTFTIGAEYYAPAFLRPYKALLASSYEKKALKAICSLITDGDHGSADYAEQGVPFVLSEAVRIGWVNVDSCRFITKRHAATLRKV